MRPTYPVQLFCSYAHEDDAYREQLFRHASAMIREGLVTAWYDGKIVPGERWNAEVIRALQESELIVALVSSDFLSSDFCVSVEIEHALARSHGRDAFVVPVVVRACDWKRTKLGQLEALPHEGRPVSLWPDRDEAYLEIIEGLRRAVGTLGSRRGVGPDSGRQLYLDAGPELILAGTVFDARSGAPVPRVCVTLGPPIRCFTRTDEGGRYLIDLAALGAPSGGEWDMYYIADGYQTSYSGKLTVRGRTIVHVPLHPVLT